MDTTTLLLEPIVNLNMGPYISAQSLNWIHVCVFWSCKRFPKIGAAVARAVSTKSRLRRNGGYVRLGPGGVLPVLVFVADTFRPPPSPVDLTILYPLYAKYERANIAQIAARCMAVFQKSRYIPRSNVMAGDGDIQPFHLLLIQLVLER